MVSSVMREKFKQTHQQKSDKESRSIRTLPLRFNLLIVVVCFTCITEAASLPVNEKENQPTNSAPTETVCNSIRCKKAASGIKWVIDEKVKPCKNFFHFACGGWMKHMWPYSMFLGQYNFVMDLEMELLESDITTLDSTVNRLISKMRRSYENCMNFNFTDSDEVQVNNLLSQVPLPYINTTGWKNMELEVFLAQLDLLEVHILFKLRFPYTPNHLDFYTFEINQPPTKIRRKYLRPGEKYRFLRQAVITEVLEKVYEYFNISDVTIDAENIVDLELLIANATECCDGDRNISISQFNSSMPNFDWRKYLDQLMSHKSPIPNTTLDFFPDNYMIKVGSPRYFIELDKILRDKNIKRTVGMFATFRLLEKFRHFLPNPYHDLFKDFAMNLSKHFSYKEYTRNCKRHTVQHFRDVISRLFSQEYFDQSAKARFEQMFLRLKSILIKRLQNVKWMDKVLKDILSRKIREMDALIGYSDRIYDAQYLENWYDWIVVSNEYLLDEIENTKRHRIIQYLRCWLPGMHKILYIDMIGSYAAAAPPNLLLMTMGTFVTSMASPEVPQYLKYGNLGFTMGHELAHLFNDLTFFYADRGGNLTNYSNETLESLKNVSECIIDKFRNFTTPLGDMNITLDVYEKRVELLADHIGFNAALEGYEQLIKEKGKAEPKLPGLDYTPEQLIFITAAQVNCEHEVWKYWSDRSAHPPWRVRFNGFTTNNQKFKEAFQCRPEDKLNAAKECWM